MVPNLRKVEYAQDSNSICYTCEELCVAGARIAIRGNQTWHYACHIRQSILDLGFLDMAAGVSASGQEDFLADVEEGFRTAMSLIAPSSSNGNSSTMVPAKSKSKSKGKGKAIPEQAADQINCWSCTKISEDPFYSQTCTASNLRTQVLHFKVLLEDPTLFSTFPTVDASSQLKAGILEAILDAISLELSGIDLRGQFTMRSVALAATLVLLEAKQYFQGAWSRLPKELQEGDTHDTLASLRRWLISPSASRLVRGAVCGSVPADRNVLERFGSLPTNPDADVIISPAWLCKVYEEVAISAASVSVDPAVATTWAMKGAFDAIMAKPLVKVKAPHVKPKKADTAKGTESILASSKKGGQAPPAPARRREATPEPLPGPMMTKGLTPIRTASLPQSPQPQASPRAKRNRLVRAREDQSDSETAVALKKVRNSMDSAQLVASQATINLPHPLQLLCLGHSEDEIARYRQTLGFKSPASMPDRQEYARMMTVSGKQDLVVLNIDGTSSLPSRNLVQAVLEHESPLPLYAAVQGKIIVSQGWMDLSARTGSIQDPDLSSTDYDVFRRTGELDFEGLTFQAFDKGNVPLTESRWYYLIEFFQHRSANRTVTRRASSRPSAPVVSGHVLVLHSHKALPVRRRKRRDGTEKAILWPDFKMALLAPSFASHINDKWFDLQ